MRKMNFARLKAFICMPYNNNTDRARAEQIFKMREQRKADAPKATADYYAGLQKTRDRTEELRQLRLERESQSRGAQSKARR
jgi:hypothetical protein